VRDVKRAILAFVFVGSKTAPLNDMTLRPAQPFYRMGVRHYLLCPCRVPELAAAGSRCVHRHAAGRVDASGGRRSCLRALRTVRRVPRCTQTLHAAHGRLFPVLRIAERGVQQVKIGTAQLRGRSAI
jgi:hypothetical protein